MTNPVLLPAGEAADQRAFFKVLRLSAHSLEWADFDLSSIPPANFERLVGELRGNERMTSRLESVVRSLYEVTDPDDVQDVLQCFFIRILRQNRRYFCRKFLMTTVESPLYDAVKAIRRQRSSTRNVQLPDDDGLHEGLFGTQDEGFGRVEAESDVQAASQIVGPDTLQWRILDLTRQGVSDDEIARSLELQSTQKVRNLRSQAREKLRMRLEPPSGGYV